MAFGLCCKPSVETIIVMSINLIFRVSAFHYSSNNGLIHIHICNCFLDPDVLIDNCEVLVVVINSTKVVYVILQLYYNIFISTKWS